MLWGVTGVDGAVDVTVVIGKVSRVIPSQTIPMSNTDKMDTTPPLPRDLGRIPPMPDRKKTVALSSSSPRQKGKSHQSARGTRAIQYINRQLATNREQQ